MWIPLPALEKPEPTLEKLALSYAELEDASKEIDTDPSEAQKASGRYKKARVSWKGLRIALESPKGSYRSGVTAEGKPWRTLMRDWYGYFEGKTAACDGDGVDVFIRSGGHIDSEIVFVVNQRKADGSFDEYKCVVGAVSEEEAKETYLRNYQAGWQGLKSVVPLTLKQFKWWLDHGDTKHEFSGDAFAYKKAAGLAEPALDLGHLLYALSSDGGE